VRFRSRAVCRPAPGEPIPGRPIYVEQLRDGERTISVTLTAENGATLIDATRDLHPGGEVEFGTVRRVGSHDRSVTVGDEAESELSESVTINESRFDVPSVSRPPRAT